LPPPRPIEVDPIEFAWNRTYSREVGTGGSSLCLPHLTTARRSGRWNRGSELRLSAVLVPPPPEYRVVAGFQPKSKARVRAWRFPRRRFLRTCAPDRLHKPIAPVRKRNSHG